MSRVSKLKDHHSQPFEEIFKEFFALNALFMREYKKFFVASPICEFLPQKFNTFMSFLEPKLIFLLFLVLR